MIPIDSQSTLVSNPSAYIMSRIGTPSASASSAKSSTEKKLQQAAAEFESILLSNLWKSMKSSFAASGEQSEDPAHDSLEDWGIQAMSLAVGKAGGLGLGKLILKHLEPQPLAASPENSVRNSKAISGFADTSP